MHMSVCHACMNTYVVCVHMCCMHVYIHVYMLHACVYMCICMCVVCTCVICMCMLCACIHMCCMKVYACVYACACYMHVCWMCVRTCVWCVHVHLVYECVYVLYACVSLYVCVLYAYVWYVYVYAYMYEDYKLMWESSSIMRQLIFGMRVSHWIWRSPVQWTNWPLTACDPCASTMLPNTGAMDTPHATARDPNLGFHAYKASALPTKSPLQPQVGSDWPLFAVSVLGCSSPRHHQIHLLTHKLKERAKPRDGWFKLHPMNQE